MPLLAIETSSARGSIALISADHCIEEDPFSKGLVHGREVLARVQGLLRRRGLGIAELDAIAVSSGPGSYTGTRVGVTAAKALAFAIAWARAPVPLVRVSSLEVMAANALALDHPGAPDHVAVLVDGKQGQLFFGLFAVTRSAPGAPASAAPLPGAVGLERRGPDRILDLRAGGPAPEIPAGALLLGDGAGAFLASDLAAGGGAWSRAPEALSWPSARALGGLALRELASARSSASFEALHRATPIYLRRSEAERKLAARLGLAGPAGDEVEAPYTSKGEMGLE